MKSVYSGSKLLFEQVQLKTMEHCLLFSIVIFQVFLLFFLRRDPDGKATNKENSKTQTKLSTQT